MWYKHILAIFLYSIFCVSFLDAKSSDIAVEIARTKKIDEVIQRVNSVNKYINLYIQETGDKNLSKELVKEYFNLDANLFKSYNRIDDFNISVSQNKVKYSDVLQGNISSKLLEYFKHSPVLHPMAVIDQNYSITIVLDPESIFILDQGVKLSKTEPVDTSSAWYKPDGKGGFEIYINKNGKWELQSSENNNKIYKNIDILNSKDELSNKKAQMGESVYVKTDNNTTNKYINVDGNTTWMIVGASSQTSTNSCTDKSLGVLRYSKEDDCMQRCTAEKEWECVDGTGKIYKSCYEIKQAKPNSKDGVYTIDPDGNGGVEPFEAYCDMTTDGGGWTAVKYTYDKTNPVKEATSHQKTNYYLSRAVVEKLLNISSTFLFKEDSSNTLAKLKTKAYPYIKNNIEQKHGWFADTYGKDNLSAWMDAIKGKNIPDAKQGSCDNFRNSAGLKTGDYMYKYVFDSCNNGRGSHLTLFDHLRMRSGAYNAKRQNFIFIGGDKADSSIKIPEAQVKNTQDFRSKSSYRKCRKSGYSPWNSTTCYKTELGCHGGDDVFNRSAKTCTQTWTACPSGWRASGAHPGYCYGKGSNYKQYKRPANGSCSSGYKPGGKKNINGKYLYCVRYIPKVRKSRTVAADWITSYDYSGQYTVYSCPTGYTPTSGNQCVKTVTTHTCPSGYKYNGYRCVLSK